MKFYTAKVSGRLVGHLFSNGVLCPFDTQLVMTNGLPDDGVLLQVRHAGHGILQLLFVSESAAGESVPEGVDMWEWAEEITPLITEEKRGTEQA